MTNLDPSKRARELLAENRERDVYRNTDHLPTVPEDTALRAIEAALAPMTPLVLDREAVARADWKDVAHRLAGLLDAMMLYCTYPNDSHPRDAMAALNYVWKPLGFRGSPRMAGQIEPAPHITPPLPNLSSAPADSIIALTSQAGGLVEDVARLIEALEPFAEQATIAEVMTGFAPHEWAGATPERRIEMIGDRKRKHDNNIVRARSVLSAIRASNPSVGGEA